ncbi:MAG: hypothetical protein IJT62_06315 [Oscillospiraceae bacterium]|nr:hypothetical protein [Oscillospiraceae bacterium]
MEEIKRYNIIYTETAAQQLEEKADYITRQLADPDLAGTWYERLRAEIQDALSSFPQKYQIYPSSYGKRKCIRLFLSRNDIVLYRIDESRSCVYIESVYTKGKNISPDLS